MTEETKETATDIAVRRDLINALESKIAGARVAWLRAKDTYMQLVQRGLPNAAAVKKAEFVEYELIIHNYSEERDRIRGWSF